jgi:hypothetical protein
MFGPGTTLPRPPDFAHERRPLRLTSEAAWQPPSGGSCHFLLLHPSVPNQRCSCQSYVRNPAAPGTACDCGHQSCYHTPSKEQGTGAPLPGSDGSLLDRIRRLEETLQYERETREREVRLLREALAPFYTNKQDVQRKLVEIEDRVEGNYDEQVRLRDQVVALDDANMGLERRIDDVQNVRSKRRRLSPAVSDLIDSGSEDRRASGNTDKRSASSFSSQAVSPTSHLSSQPQEQEEPRSSGILNLIEMTTNPRTTPVPIRNTPSRTYEARSSGFLALDLAHRLGKNGKQSSDTSHQHSYPPAYSAFQQSPPDYSQSDSDTALRRGSPVNGTLKSTLSQSMSPRKRKLPIALDVLADVSMASPMVHG